MNEPECPLGATVTIAIAIFVSEDLQHHGWISVFRQPYSIATQWTEIEFRTDHAMMKFIIISEPFLCQVTVINQQGMTRGFSGCNWQPTYFWNSHHQFSKKLCSRRREHVIVVTVGVLKELANSR